MTGCLSHIIIILILFTAVTGAFHTHDDGTDQHDCSICIASDHISDSAYATPAVAYRIVATRTAYFIPQLTITCTSRFTPANGRAPPA
jgi:hypothetical protein